MTVVRARVRIRAGVLYHRRRDPRGARETVARGDGEEEKGAHHHAHLHHGQLFPGIHDDPRGLHFEIEGRNVELKGG